MAEGADQIDHRPGQSHRRSEFGHAAQNLMRGFVLTVNKKRFLVQNLLDIRPREIEGDEADARVDQSRRQSFAFPF